MIAPPRSLTSNSITTLGRLPDGDFIVRISNGDDFERVVNVVGAGNAPDFVVTIPANSAAILNIGNVASGVSYTATGFPGTATVNNTLLTLSTPAETFTYTINDGQGGTSSATVNITVTPTNDAPVARVDSRNLNEDVAGLSGNVIRPASANTGERNDTDKDGDALTVTGVAAGAPAVAPSTGVGTTIVGSLGTLVLSADGSYTYTPGAGAQALNGGQTAADVFTYTVSDGQGGSASTTLTMRVSGSNDAPVIDLDGDDSSGASGSGYRASHVAAGPVAIADADLQVVDIDSPLLQRATVTLTNAQAGDVLTAGSLPSGISAALVGNVLTLSGAASTADYALALRAVGFDSSAASPPAGDRIITVSVFDGNLTSNLAASTITVIDQNDTPVNTLPGAVTAVEDTRIAIPGLSVADPDAGSAVSAFKLATVALGVSNGSLRLVLAEGVTITGGANDSAALTLSGPQVAINTTLDSLSYIGNRDHNGGDVLTVASRDALGLTDSDSVQVSVSGVNDAPTLAITQPSSPAFTEATGLGTQGAAVAVFSGVAVGTVEEAQTIQALTFAIDGIRDGLNEVLRLDGVTIALNSVNRSGTTPTNGMAFSVVYSGSTDNATATVTLTKSGGVSTAAMKSLLEGITYQNTHLDNPSVGDRPFTITRIQDNGGTAGGGVDVLLPNLVSTVRVVGVNDAPVAKTDEPPTNAVAGTGTAVTGNAVTGAGTGNIADTDPENALLRITGLAAGSTEAVLGNTAIVAPVTVKGVYGSLTFNADGSYSYLIDNADADTLALPGGGRATDVFSYTVTDSGGTGTGGALTDTGQITIQVAGPSTLTSSSTPINPLSYGVLGEFFGYNDNRTGRAGDLAYNPAAGSTTRWHADDGRASASLGGGVATGGVNLESTGDALFVINGRNVAAGGSAVTGTPTRSRDAATDARWIATDFDYGFNPQVNGSLGSNPKASSGSGASALPSGSLRDYIGTDINTLQITGGIGNTTDAVVRTFGYIYQPGGFADFRVTADDGFTLFLNGVEVAQYSANQGPTTREFIGKELQAGMNLLEMVYWEQGGNARLRVEAKNSGTDASQWANLLSLDNSALFQPGLQPVLTAGQDIVETSTNRVWEIRTGATFAGSVNADTVTGSSSRDVITGNNGADNVRAGSGADNLSGGDGNDSLIGEAGADIVNGDAGDDSVDGGFGSDFLSGGVGNDIVVGGAGWDRLTGGSGTDTFDWNLADRGVAAGRAENPVAGTTANFNGVSSNGSRAQDFISDFDARPAASGGDVLDLRDLLIGETPATLDRFLDFNVIAGASPSTEIRISTAGGFSGGTYNSAVEDQRIVLEGVDIRASLGLAANASDSLIVQTLIDRAKLLVDA
jgi:large repetitive protein